MFNLLKKIILSAAIFVVFIPIVSFAQTEEKISEPQKDGVVNFINPITLGGDVSSRRPLIEIVEQGLGQVLRNMFAMLGVLSAIPMVLGGIKYIISQTSAAGDADKVQAAKDTLYWGIVGMAIGFSGLIVINFLLSFATTTS